MNFYCGNACSTRIGIIFLWEAVFIWRKMERLFLSSIACMSPRLPVSTWPYGPSILAQFLVNILYIVLKTKVTEVTDFELLKIPIVNKQIYVFWLCVCATEKPSPWMCVDTALYLVTGNKTKEDSTLVCFTELRDKEVSKCITFLSKYDSIVLSNYNICLYLKYFDILSAVI